MKKLALALGVSAALLAGTASAHEAGSVVLRAGGALVIANSNSYTKGGPVDVGLEVNNNAQLGLTGTYMITDNLGIELLAATPFSHKISAHVAANPAVAQAINAPMLNNNINLGEVVKVKHLPPSLYAQYYFLDKNAGSRPYIGLGLNYTRFFGAKSLVGDEITDLQVKKHSFAPVINAGIDIKLTDNLYFNTAMWYTRIKTNAKFKSHVVKDADGNVIPVNHEVKIKLDPIVFFSGLSYRF